jgi:2-oxoglutarate dehydrogenase E2 component (dihydrolipoamide succinyltransferase)
MSIIDIIVPFEQEGTKAIVRSWMVKVGQFVAKDEPLVELETDKVTQEVPSPESGILTEILLETDAEAIPGALLGRLRINTKELGVFVEQPKALPEAINSGAPSNLDQQADIFRLSPAVRRAIKQHGVDPALVPGTGRGGRITRADVDNYIANRGVSAPEPLRLSAESSAANAIHSTVPPVSNGITSIPHDRMRLAIAANMLNSVTVAPHVTAVFEADFSAIMAHRKKYKSSFERDGANLTFTAYIVAACVSAMQKSPSVNSRWHEDRIDVFSDVNIGIGTALGDKGLIVPVLQKAQTLSLLGIAKGLTAMTARAREGQLGPADVRGGTFTISNHGVSGSLVATPIIIAQPQSAILGVGKLEKRVVVREVDGVDTIQIRPMCFVSLTIDHRVLDGHQTNLWLSEFVKTLEGWPADV